MNRSPFFVFAGVLAAGLAIVAFAIAGTGGENAAPVKVASQDEIGKDLFATNCGACHTLAAAGTDGVVGPDLDVVLAPGGTANYEGSYDRALRAITCGFGGGRMPAGILQGEQAQDVAAFVGAYAGQDGANAEPLVDTETEPRGPAPTSCSTD